MDILYIMLPLACLFAALIGAVFVWAVNSRQFDDLQGPASNILEDDDAVL